VSSSPEIPPDAGGDTGGPLVDPAIDQATSTHLPDWWEDNDLAAAVAEAEQFAGEAGWDAPPRLFALVVTDELRAAQPDLTAHLADNGHYTPIAQDALPAGDLEQALAGIEWPASVAGCVLVQEILVVPPEVADELADDPAAATRAAAHPARTEARLTAGVIRGVPGGACLLRVRPPSSSAPEAASVPLRGADLAPGLIAALQATFH
jgi:hypothetical protein